MFTYDGKNMMQQVNTRLKTVQTMLDVPQTEYDVEDMGLLDVFLFSRSLVCRCECFALGDVVFFQRRQIGRAALL